MSPPSPPPPPASSGSGEASSNNASAGASLSSSDVALNWLREQTYTPSSLHEHLALAVHALLLGHGFRPAETPPTSSFESQPPPLPADWAAGGYGGRYLHGRSALRFEIRAVPLGARLRIAAVVVTENEDDDPQTASLDLRVARFVRNGDSNERAEDAQQHHLTNRLDDFAALAALVQVNIAHVLVPDSAKEGYEARASAPNTAANDSSSSSAVPAVGGSAVPPPRPRRFIPPVEGDPLRDPLQIGPPRMPVGVGGDRGDLYGRDDLLAPGLQGFPDPRAGIGAGMPGLGGGNLMGPRNFPGVPGVRPRPRGMPPGVPPGARYDPMGPGGLGPDNDIDLPPGRNMRDPDEEPPPGMYW